MIVKKRLAKLSMGYCITAISVQGRRYIITASEEREGDILLIDAETDEVRKLTGLHGGVMTILPLEEDEGAFICIHKFYPIFDSADAEIVYCKIPDAQGDSIEMQTKVLFKQPYTHRIGLMGQPGARKIVAASLCNSKAFQEDWSQVGDANMYYLDREYNVVKTVKLSSEIHKHHGMYAYTEDDGKYIAFGGEEGLWSVDEQDKVRLIYDEPVSDICMFDIDKDGKNEIIAIAPFHGNKLEIRKKLGENWEVIAADDINFGHAVWCGSFCGMSAVICCERGGEKQTNLYLLNNDDGRLKFKKYEIDRGVGATNLIVESSDRKLEIYAANHGLGETAKYIITSD